MADLYRKNGRGTWYAPSWRLPGGAVMLPAHSLETDDRAVAECRWIRERARAIDALPVHNRSVIHTDGAPMLLSQVFAEYLRTRHDLRTATVGAYEQYGHLIIDGCSRGSRRGPGLGDWSVAALAPPEGDRLLASWFESCVSRGVAKHTMWKWIVGLLLPALKWAKRQRLISELPEPPRFGAEYTPRDRALTVEQYAALRRHLPIAATVYGVRCYPRLIADVAVTTGMHAKDLWEFTGDRWRPDAREWKRVNSKADQKFKEPKWFAAPPLLVDALERSRVGGWPQRQPILLAQPVLPPELCDPRRSVCWFRAPLVKAARLAELPWSVSLIDLRHTCVTWQRDEGWQESESAEWLANSSGIVRRVYAATYRPRINELVERSEAARAAAALIQGETFAPTTAPAKVLEMPPRRARKCP